MAIAVLIPKLGMTMTEGTVAEWLVPDGGIVKPGEIVYRLETEKIQFEVEAEAEGTVRHLVPEGTKLEPGAVVAYILAPGEALPAGAQPVVAAAIAAGASAPASAASAAASRLPDGRVPASPIARRLAKEFGLSLDGIAGAGPGGRITEADVLAARQRPAAAPAAASRAAPPSSTVAGAPPIASPLARRLADTLGIDLGAVRGSGPGGRITKEDVEQFAARPPQPSLGPAAPARPAAAPQPAAGAVLPLRGMRRVIAERMHASLQDMA